MIDARKGGNPVGASTSSAATLYAASCNGIASVSRRSTRVRTMSRTSGTDNMSDTDRAAKTWVWFMCKTVCEVTASEPACARAGPAAALSGTWLGRKALGGPTGNGWPPRTRRQYLNRLRQPQNMPSAPRFSSVLWAGRVVRTRRQSDCRRPGNRTSRAQRTARRTETFASGSFAPAVRRTGSGSPSA